MCKQEKCACTNICVCINMRHSACTNIRVYINMRNVRVHIYVCV